MANEEQVKILNQGVEVWNAWRQEHRDEEVDLREADLVAANLFEVNLREAHLERANLSETHLVAARLTSANLGKADLSRTDLTSADLRGADLYEAHLGGADLNGAHLSGADLRGAGLFNANLFAADLFEADLRYAQLVATNLSQTTLTGVCLYGTARDDWTIDEVQCDYVYWDSKWKERTPADRNFRPGEFEELYKQLPTFEYYFEQGFSPLDPLVINDVVRTINNRHPEFHLDLTGFDKRGTPHATFTTAQKEFIECLLDQVAAEYATRMKVLGGQKEVLLELFSRTMAQGVSIDKVEGNFIVNNNQRSITAGRDYHERIDGHAQVSTGNSADSDTSERSETP